MMRAMALFHVFLDGAVDASPAGLERLAAGMAEHYGIAAADVRSRLARGRIRVKANVDRGTAEQYVRDLSALGGRCAIEEASAQNSHPTPLPFPAVAPPAPAPPAPAPARTTTPLPGSILPPRTTAPPPTASMTSGLAAAFTGQIPVASLGALEQEGGALSLSSVDGAEAGERVAAPAATALPASIGPAVAPAPAAKAAPRSEPVDPFAPPDADAAAKVLDLADDPGREVRKRTSPVPLVAPGAATPVTVAPAPSRLRDPKVRFAAGVAVAVLLGFVPAHLVVHAREHDTFRDIDAKVAAAQRMADTPDTYSALDGLRATQLAHKRSMHDTDALLGFLIWAVVGGGIAYVWFRRIPWD